MNFNPNQFILPFLWLLSTLGQSSCTRPSEPNPLILDIEDLLPCPTQTFPTFPCKIPILLIICKDVSLTFATTFPNKGLKYNFDRQVSQGIALLKSLTLTLWADKRAHPPLRNVYLEVTLFGDDLEAYQKFSDELENWAPDFRNWLSLTWHPADYTPELEWSQSLFAPCASFRLQFPGTLQSVDSVIYLDTDLLFLGSPWELWTTFSQMNQSKALSMAQESQLYIRDHLPQALGFPQVKVKSHNAGILLMNLTKLRDPSSGWDYWLDYIKDYKEFLTYADQDILNLYVHKYPETLLTLPCSWNFLAYYVNPIWQDFCDPTGGVQILQGTSRLFWFPGRFSIIFQNFLNLQLSSPQSFLGKNGLDPITPVIHKDLNSTLSCQLQNVSVLCNDPYFQKAFRLS